MLSILAVCHFFKFKCPENIWPDQVVSFYHLYQFHTYFKEPLNVVISLAIIPGSGLASIGSVGFFRINPGAVECSQLQPIFTGSVMKYGTSSPW